MVLLSVRHMRVRITSVMLVSRAATVVYTVTTNRSLLYVLRIVILFSATLGGGSTGVIQEPRHRPLLLVSYRTARIRELPPPADWSGH